MYAVHELIIEEWYINPQEKDGLTLFNYQQIHDSCTYLSELLALVYFATIKMAVLLSELLLIVKHNFQIITFMFQLIHTLGKIKYISRGGSVGM
jgi:hypothetical protein